MLAIDELLHEHRAVEIMLEVLDRLCGKLAEGGKKELKDLKSILEFLEVFVDKCHHAKEEKELFPALLESSRREWSAKIDELLAEHEKGRALIRGLRGSPGSAPVSRDAARSAASAQAREYIALLREHIENEEKLFQAADKLLGASRQQELKAGFDKIEAERIGPGRHEQFHQLIDRLKAEYPG